MHVCIIAAYYVQVREVTRWNRADMYIAKGMPCVITLHWTHNHDTKCAEALRYHAPGQDVKDMFTSYFNEGMGPAAAMKFHRDCLEMDVAFTEQELADSGRNPLPRSVYHWHDQWRQLHLGN